MILFAMWDTGFVRDTRSQVTDFGDIPKLVKVKVVVAIVSNIPSCFKFVSWDWLEPYWDNISKVNFANLWGCSLATKGALTLKSMSHDVCHKLYVLRSPSHFPGLVAFAVCDIQIVTYRVWHTAVCKCNKPCKVCYTMYVTVCTSHSVCHIALWVWHTIQM